MTPRASTALPVNRSADYMTFLPWLACAQDISNYLEIGVNTGHLLKLMPVENAIGVDPNFSIDVNVAEGKRNLHLVQKTSDRFFLEDRDLLQRYVPQLFFLDGMHLFEYLLRDFINTESFCGRKSLIAMHDCLPLSAGMCHRNIYGALPLTQGTPYHGMWTGDVWKIIPILKKYREDLEIVCVDAAPTGLVLVSNLNPMSKILENNYLSIVGEFSKIEDSTENIAGMFASIDMINASDMMESFSHGLYFRN